MKRRHCVGPLLVILLLLIYLSRGGPIGSNAQKIDVARTADSIAYGSAIQEVDNSHGGSGQGAAAIKVSPLNREELARLSSWMKGPTGDGKDDGPLD
jgi:hypothetical protein